MLQFCEFVVSWLYCIFSWARTQVEPVNGFSVYGTYDVFTPKDGRFGGCDNIGIHWG